MKPDEHSEGLTYYEKRARTWDRWATAIIVAILLLPFPFARFEAWPGGRVVSEHLITPWSGFKICYTDFPGGDAVEDRYEFTWKGEVLPNKDSMPYLFIFSSSSPPLLKWQSSPEVVLREIFYSGYFLKLETVWQPILLWPFKMAWRVAPKS